jgi:hypothetical protein
MYVTSSFIGIQKGNLDYLFFYLTEEYIEDQASLKQQLSPLLEEFARNLKHKGAVVTPFNRDVLKTKQEVLDKWEQQNLLRDVVEPFNEKQTPGLLIINTDFEIFNPTEHQYIYISFRDFISQYGAISILDLKDFFDTIIKLIQKEENLFTSIRHHLRIEALKKAHKILELKPGYFGINIDLREALEVIKNIKKNWR